MMHAPLASTYDTDRGRSGMYKLYLKSLIEIDSPNVTYIATTSKKPIWPSYWLGAVKRAAYPFPSRASHAPVQKVRNNFESA